MSCTAATGLRTGVSEAAYENFGLKAREYTLRKLVYAEIRDVHGIKSAAAQQLIKKVTDACTTLRGNIKAGNLGKEGSKRGRRRSPSRSCSVWTRRRRTTTAPSGRWSSANGGGLKRSGRGVRRLLRVSPCVVPG
jgi:hypothetical protein